MDKYIIDEDEQKAILVHFSKEYSKKLVRVVMHVFYTSGDKEKTNG